MTLESYLGADTQNLSFICAFFRERGSYVSESLAQNRVVVNETNAFRVGRVGETSERRRRRRQDAENAPTVLDGGGDLPEVLSLLASVPRECPRRLSMIPVVNA